MTNDLQRTQSWYLARKGMITASEISVLMKNGKRPMTDEELANRLPKSKVTTVTIPFSDATYTYLDEKVAERFMSNESYIHYLEECVRDAPAMRWGREYEAFAIDIYEQFSGNEVEACEFIKHDSISGGSPDGAINAEYKDMAMISAKKIIEVKCPYNPAVHFRYFKLQTPGELLELNEQYYAQMQKNMMCLNADSCDFISFDPRVNENVRLKVLEIPFNAGYCNELSCRTDLAKAYMIEQMGVIQKIGEIYSNDKI